MVTLHLVTASADLHRLAKLLEVNEKGNSTETSKKKATMAHVSLEGRRGDYLGEKGKRGHETGYLERDGTHKNKV